MFSCNYTKHLQNNQRLLNKNTIVLKTNKPIKYKGEFESSILSLISPQPNSHIFDLDMLPKFKLWKYNNRFQYYEKNPLDKKLVKHKVEKPVLLDTQSVNKSERMIKQFMINQGYYFSEISSKIDSSTDKIANIEYSINAGKSYYISNVKFIAENEKIESILPILSENTIFKKGEVFTNYTCSIERERIYKLMRNRGYYDFKTDNTNFIADTSNKNDLKKLLDDPFELSINYSVDTSRNDSMEVLISIEKTKDSTYFHQYTIDSVIVTIGDFSNPFNASLPYTTNELDNIIFKYQTLPINRKVITRNIFVQPGALFNTTDQEATINRLNQLNVFSNVNLKYEKSKQKPGSLICRINLTVTKKYEFQYLGDLSTSDGYLLGIGSSVTFRDKNLLYGANQFSLKASGALQYSQLDSTKNLTNSGVNANISASLVFPKFIVPFSQNLFDKKNIPSTVLGLNYNYNNRVGNYTILNISGSFGYNWRETQEKSWILTPAFLTLNFVPEGSLSPEFKAKILANEYLNNIFKRYIISGENMSFQYKSKPKNIYGNFNSVKFGIEEAGTIIKGIDYLYNKTNNKHIEPIARYIKVDFDFRKYLNFRKSQWVNRIILGIGAPICDNLTLPYIKQYSAGGPSSLRGWTARRIGPGRSSNTAYNTNNKSYIDRTGDIKFEANTEYRFNLLKLFSGAINIKGATFIDAGNIWLFKKSEDIPGGEINSKYLLQDIAMDAGAGLRFDFSFFIFCFDVGYQLKDPTVPTNYGFKIDQLNIKSGNINIAINYPF